MAHYSFVSVWLSLFTAPLITSSTTPTLPEWVEHAHIVFSNHLDVGFDGVGSLSPSIALTVILLYNEAMSVR